MSRESSNAGETAGEPDGERLLTGRPQDVSFTLPDDWWRIRLRDDQARQADIAALATRVTAGRPDARPMARQLTDLLDEITEDSEPHAVETWLSLLTEGGWPIACSLTLAIIPAPGQAGRSLLHAGLVQLAGGPSEVAVIDTLAGPATRVHRQVVSSLGGKDLPSEVMQYVIAFPDGDGAVLLSFSTPLLGATEAFFALFDSIAASTRWVW